MRQPSKSNLTIDAGARPVSNWRGWLVCDFCGVASDPLYTSERHAGAFCVGCIKDVLHPAPPSPVKLAKDGEPVENDIAIIRKLDAFLKKRAAQPVFCGIGRGRPKRGFDAQPCPKDSLRPTDCIRIVRRDGNLTGIQANIFSAAAEGGTVGAVLDRIPLVGWAVRKKLKRLAEIGVLAIERAA